MLHMQCMHAFLQGKHNNHDCRGEGEHRTLQPPQKHAECNGRKRQSVCSATMESRELPTKAPFATLHTWRHSGTHSIPHS